MKYGLADNTIKSIQKVFNSIIEIEEVILYGSRANGKEKIGSDIDLTLKGENLNLDTINKAAILLDDLNLPYTFDLSIYNQIENTSLIEHINHVGISFYDRKTSRQK